MLLEAQDLETLQPPDNPHASGNTNTGLLPLANGLAIPVIISKLPESHPYRSKTHQVPVMPPEHESLVGY